VFKPITRRYKAGFIALLLFVSSVPAVAYVGPGAGLTLLGSLLGLIFAILFVLFGIVSWPLRMLWRRFFAKKSTANETEEDPHS